MVNNPVSREPSPTTDHGWSAWFKRILANKGLTEKDAVFRELGERFAGQPETVRLAQAIWLTGRGQAYARRGRFFNALDCFAEAMTLKRDHIPAYLAMAITFRRLGQAGGSYSYLDVSMNLLKRLPRRMRLAPALSQPGAVRSLDLIRGGHPLHPHGPAQRGR